MPLYSDQELLRVGWLLSLVILCRHAYIVDISFDVDIILIAICKKIFNENLPFLPIPHFQWVLAKLQTLQHMRLHLQPL